MPRIVHSPSLPRATISRAATIKALLSGVCLSVAIGVFLGIEEVVGFFIWSTVDQASVILANGHLPHLQWNNLAYSTFLAILMTVLDIKGDVLTILPVGIIVVPIVYYMVTRWLFESSILGLAGMGYIITDIAQTGWHNIFAYVWVRPLYLLGLLILVAIFLTDQYRKSRRLLGVFLVLFGALPFLHYTPGGWLIIFMAIILAIGILDGQAWVGAVGSLIVLTVVIYFSTAQVVYNTFLPALGAHLTGNATVDPIERFSSLIASMIGGESFQSEYAISRSTPIYSRLRLLLNLLFGGVIVAAAPVTIKRLYDQLRRPDTVDASLYLFIGLVATMGIHAVVYGIVFSISTQLLIFLGPIFGFLALDQLRANKRTVYSFVMAVLMLGVASMLLRFGQIMDGLVRYSLIAPGADWFAMYAMSSSGQETQILSSIHLHSYYYYLGDRQLITPAFITPDIYAAIVNDGGSVAGHADYFVTDRHSRETVVWGTTITNEYEPWGHYQPQINANPDLDKIHSDGRVETYAIADTE